jgi:hypothetical protein
LRKYIFVLTLFVFLTGSFDAGIANEVAGRVLSLAGTVTVERLEKQESLKTGDPVFVKDRIVTSSGSSALILFIDQSWAELAPETGLKIVEYQFKPVEKIRYGLVSLDFGKAGFSVREFQQFDDRRFRVLTETALISCRDTRFIVSYIPEPPRDEVCRPGLTNALCLEDSIIVTSLGFQERPVVITARMMSQVCGANPPAPPRFATMSESSRMMDGLDRIRTPGSNIGDRP